MKTFQKGSKEMASRHFMACEFDCPCTDIACTTTMLDEQLLDQADAMRDELGCPMEITSGNRCAFYQAQLKSRGYETAVGISQHQLGKAFDCKTATHTGDALEQVARRHGFQSVGVGKRFIHADMRMDKPGRRWTYSY